MGAMYVESFECPQLIFKPPALIQDYEPLKWRRFRCDGTLELLGLVVMVTGDQHSTDRERFAAVHEMNSGPALLKPT